MKTLLLIISITLSSQSFARLPPANHDTKKKASHDHKVGEIKKTKDNKIIISVNGMVCAFCAQGITDKFKSKKEVKDIKVDLDKMQVILSFQKGQTLKESTIKDIITDAGFKYVGLNQ